MTLLELVVQVVIAIALSVLWLIAGVRIGARRTRRRTDAAMRILAGHHDQAENTDAVNRIIDRAKAQAGQERNRAPRLPRGGAR